MIKLLCCVRLCNSSALCVWDDFHGNQNVVRNIFLAIDRVHLTWLWYGSYKLEPTELAHNLREFYLAPNRVNAYEVTTSNNSVSCGIKDEGPLLPSVSFVLHNVSSAVSALPQTLDSPIRTPLSSHFLPSPPLFLSLSYSLIHLCRAFKSFTPFRRCHHPLCCLLFRPLIPHKGSSAVTPSIGD